MSSVTVEPATLMDLAELSGANTRPQWGLALDLFQRGQFYTFRADGERIALGAINPLGDGAAEATFNPAPLARRHMLGFLAGARLTIAAAPYRRIVMICRTSAGKLFARRIGFQFETMSELGEVWAYGGPSDGQDGKRQPAGAEGRGRGQPADDAGPAGGATG